MEVKYYVINPAGNITALVTTGINKALYRSVAANIMKTEPSVEQVGFIEFCDGGVKLNMSGGEFCGNATMCAAALLCEMENKETAQIPVTVSPYTKPFCVSVSGRDGGFICECVFNKPETVKEFSFSAAGKKYTFPLADFEGISHIIADNTLSEAAARQVIKPIAAELKTSALGIMIYDSGKKSLLPLVYVTALDTLFRENSCASGSCALAAVLPQFLSKTDINEPGGTICALRTKEGVYLKTNVKIIKQFNGEM